MGLTVLLRIGRRKGDYATAEEIVGLFFTTKDGKIDANASVYEIESDETVRAVSEHQASTCGNPKSADHLNVEGIAECRPSDGETSFEFTRSHHATVPLTREHATTFAEGILGSLGNRLTRVTHQQIKGFIAAQHENGDAEWTDYCGTAAAARKFCPQEA